jgi:hypothetical protein
MVLEGKKFCIRIRRNRLRELNRALSDAGYNRRTNFRFVKPNEKAAWTLDRENNRQVHVQVIDSGNYLELFAHTEPSVNLDPFGHAVGAISETRINFGAGCGKLKADLKKVGFKFTSR